MLRTKTRRLVAGIAAVLALAGIGSVIVPAVAPTAAPIVGPDQAGAVATGGNTFCFHSPTGRYRIGSGENNNAGAYGELYATDGTLMYSWQPNTPSYWSGKRWYYSSQGKVPLYYVSYTWVPFYGWVYNSTGYGFANQGLCPA